ncbi:LipA and NB-ARC domain-containing protein [Colletotrichum truncatum]|uniref:LipA and NB-ARC domain-containing protein n=1 Tax=Colletotrichum truncatum TaxID=5467 RepID=A0ACC3YJU7_COLTU|nr:LipA and NB-ARC domain-containing protein [Colletotrichum truncatum]KAF6797413.1 LipA and NB-ARC domain-containing protein [Colletotrichum truncatum]
MEAPKAALRRKPLPGQLPGPPPMPPPPDFDPFPQRRQVLRGARSTPNLRQSAVPSIYDPPPAYEEFPGVDANGRLVIAPPSPGRLPSPAPPSPGPFFPGPPQSAETFSVGGYRPPVSPVSPASSYFPPPPNAESHSVHAHYRPPVSPVSPLSTGTPYFPPPPNAAGYPPQAHNRPPASPVFHPPSNAATFPVQAHDRPPPSPVFQPPPTAETFPLSGPRPPASPVYAPSEAPSTDTQSKEKTFWQTALDETKYFAGGLISHPFEYTKHYSILRHSAALVWYRGPSTSVTVTIFSDAPLPPTRTVWLQRKGFSGNMGMNLKSLVGANDSWLDVTPSAQALPTDMAEGDERGCQRDIKKFLKKAPKNLSKHVPRETHVVRIPAAADDGYFRLVLCAGGGDGGNSKRKVLCPSPVFRIASTSTDASVMRGASFASMPLEMGIKAGSIVATTVANRYIGPAAAVVQSRTKKLQQAKFVTKHATHIATAKSGFDKSGIKTTVTAYEEQYAASRSGGYAAWQDGGETGFQEAPPEVIGPDSGPLDPFPIKFDGKIVRGTGRGGMELGIPTANLTGIPEDVKMRMRGVYFGWARVVPRTGLQGISTDWHESIITVGPAPYATPRVAATNVATVHLIHEFGGALFLDTKLKVLVMGQLRLAAPPVAGSDAALAAYGADVLLAVASLSRDNWGPVETRERMRTMRSEMSLADRYLETRERVQKQVDRIPVHLAGVRTEGAALRDRAYGNGGMWIPR